MGADTRLAPATPVSSRGHGWGLAVAGAALLAVTGCAGTRIVQGVYHSPKGYRVTLPGAEWEVVADSRAELELRHTREAAGMLVHASCEPGTARRTLGVLRRQLLIGLREREVKESGVVSVNGREATHAILEARMDGHPERVQIELYVVKGERCVYDLMYAAPPAAFAARQGDFHRLVESLDSE